MARDYLLKPWMMICLMYILSAGAAGLQLPWKSHDQIESCRKGSTAGSRSPGCAMNGFALELGQICHAEVRRGLRRVSRDDSTAGAKWKDLGTDHLGRPGPSTD